MKHGPMRWGAAVLIAGLIAAGCGDDDDSTAAPSPADTPTTEATDETTEAPDETTEAPDDSTMDDGGDEMAAPSVTTAASTLRAGLTSLLQEHVYLAGAAISQAVADGGDMEAPATKSAVETLDANSVALSEAVASVYGDEAGEAFLGLWRAHIGMFVDYTLGGATGDKAMQEKAAEDLDGYRKEFGAFIQSATDGELDSAAVEAELDTHVKTLIAAVDAVLAGDPSVYPKLAEAASHMPMTAQALSGAIAAQQDLEGDVAAPASELRAGLTHLLQEHVYLAGLAINQAVADGGDMEAPATKSAVETLDANSVALSEAVGSVYGPDAGEAFLGLWRAHIGMFVDYTLGGATGDTAKQEKAAADLDQYRKEFGAFIDSATGGELDSKTVEAELDTHVKTLVAAVDAVLAGDPSVYPKLQEAASHMPMTAEALSAAIVAQMPDEFAG